MGGTMDGPGAKRPRMRAWARFGRTPSPSRVSIVIAVACGVLLIIAGIALAAGAGGIAKRNGAPSPTVGRGTNRDAVYYSRQPETPRECPPGSVRGGEEACVPVVVPSPPPPPLPPKGPLPLPVLGKTVNIEPVSGTVFVKLPPGAAGAARVGSRGAVESLSKGTGFIPLTEARQIPVGSELNTLAGVVRLTTASAKPSVTQSGDFGAGLFTILQNRKQKGLSELRLINNRAPKKLCATVGKGRKAAAAKRRLSSAVVGRLRANSHGRYTIHGQYSAATVRGTVWGVSNQCNGTLTTVTRGNVEVRDLVRRKTIKLFTGQHYLAKP